MNSFLTPRLLKIAEMVPEGAAVIDVGTDHAYIPIHLVSEKKVKRALATDINEGPIRRAAENIARFDLTDYIGTQKANGLSGVDSTGYDTVIIAGMGGILISEILENYADANGKTFILQPMTASMELRAYLLNHGYMISEEAIVREEEKLYTVIKAKKGEDMPYTEAELLLGRKNANDPLYPILKSKTIKKLKVKLSGILRAKEQNGKEIERIINLIKEMEL